MKLISTSKIKYEFLPWGTYQLEDLSYYGEQEVDNKSNARSILFPIIPNLVDHKINYTDFFNLTDEAYRFQSIHYNDLVIELKI